MNIDEFNALSNLAKTKFLEENYKASELSISRRKVMHGVGINDSTYMTRVRSGNGRLSCPAYSCWHDIIGRTSSERIKEKRNCYADVSVCKEWTKFLNFRAWWIKNQVDGWQIDKDIITDKRIYSPDTCIFVPASINLFMVDSRSIRGDCPIGVYLDSARGMFMSRCHNPSTGKHEFIGRFASPDDASDAWFRRKIEHAKNMKPEMDAIDSRIYGRAVEIISRSK